MAGNGQYLRVRRTFVAARDGGHEVFREGTLLPPGHWAIKGRRELLETQAAAVDRDAARVSFTARPVEAATRAPGEVRQTRRLPPDATDDQDET